NPLEIEKNKAVTGQKSPFGTAIMKRSPHNFQKSCGELFFAFSQTIFRSAEKKSFLSGKNSQILHIIRIFIQNEHLTGPFFRFIHRLKTIIRLRFV
ncbi:hypothetical protein, partial [Paraprevotella clara]|uniref:hypothetical protein n=1 Tax=Paraprevotella clara TaxID=454154 RepID=UPI002FD89118